MDNHNLPPVLSLEQASVYLQLDVEELQRELEQNHIPGRRIANKWRISREVLERWLDSSRNATTTNQSKAKPIANPTVSAKKLSDTPDTQAESKPGSGTSIYSNPVNTQTLTLPTTAASSTPTKKTITTPKPSTPKRIQAHVFVYNPIHEDGRARFDDYREITFYNKNLKQGSAKPYLGDTIEFDPVLSAKGEMEAHEIVVVAKGERQPSVFAPTTQPKVKNGNGQNKPSIAKPGSPTTTPSPALKAKASATLENAKSRELYQKAAVAKTEGRNDEARRLLRQAIKEGANAQAHIALFTLEQGEKRFLTDETRQIIERAITLFPDNVTLFELYGQQERRARRYQQAEQIFRQGLKQCTIPKSNKQLRRGLAQTLVQKGDETSLREAEQIFAGLTSEGGFDKRDPYYQRSLAFQRNPRANKVFDFFREAGLAVGIAKQQPGSKHIVDIVVQDRGMELQEAFGLSGGFLVRCFDQPSRPTDIKDLKDFLNSVAKQTEISVEGESKKVILNNSVAFIAVPIASAINDQLMAILSESSAAIVPIDDAIIQQGEEPSLSTLQDLLGQFLGRRDLYNATQPVSGRRFFGRERLLLQLTDDVYQGKFLGVYGLRKMGKTSLLEQLRSEKLSGEAVAYFDLEGISGDFAQLYWELEQLLYQRLHKEHPEAAQIFRLAKYKRYSDIMESKIQVPLFFAEDIRSFLDELYNSRIPGIKRLVIVLDELEYILPTTSKAHTQGFFEFFGLLRGLMQMERYRGLLSSIVIAANATISERGYWEGRENPVFALYKPLFLPPFSKEESTEMIRTLGKGMSVYWEDEAINAVWVETGGHPFLTREFCSDIAKRNPARPLDVTLAMVQAAILPFLQTDSDKLKQITELLNTYFPEEEKLLEKIALDEISAQVADDALPHLFNYHLVAVEGKNYRITLNLLRRWLRWRAGVQE